MRILILALLLSSVALANLKLVRRVGDHLCIQTDDHPATVAVKVERSAAVLTLPKPGDQRSPLAFTLNLVSESPACGGLAAVVEGKAKEELSTYTAAYEPGKRMEPVLSVRDVGIQKKGRLKEDHESLTEEVPNEFQMNSSDADTDLDDWLLVFLVKYLPEDIASKIKNADAWCVTAGEYDGDNEKPCGDPSYKVLKADYDKDTGTLELRLEDSVLDDPTQPLNVVFIPSVNPPAAKDGTKRKLSKAAQRQLTFRRAPRTVRRKPIAFRAATQKTSQQMPFSINVTTTTSLRKGSAWSNVYTVEFHVNQPFTLQPLKTSRRWNIHHGPELHFNGTNDNTADDVNAASAGWLFEFSRYFPAQCGTVKGGGCDFTRPPFRRFSLEVQPKIEMTANGRDKNVVLRAPYVHFYAPKRLPLLANGTLGGNIGGGFENGRTLTSRVDSVTARDGKRTFQRTLRADYPIRRATADAHLNIVFKKTGAKIADTFQSVSLDFDWVYYRLSEPEQQFVPVPVAGRFLANDITEVPEVFRNVRPDTTYAFLAPTITQGSRRFYKTKLNFEIGKDFSVFAVYERGELAPAFQFTNRIRTGIQFEIGGKGN